MTTINASPIHSIVEATQFTATPESAQEVMAVLRAGAAASNNVGLQMSYSEAVGQPVGLYIYIDGIGYNLGNGDWLIKDGDLFSVCPDANFPQRYATEAAAS